VAIALLVSLVTSAACLADVRSRHAPEKETDACGLPLTPPTLLPPYLRIHPEAVDVRLNWTASTLELSKHFSASAAADASPAPAFALPPALINPSLLWTPDGRLLRAARLHATGCMVQPDADYNGTQVTELRTIWLSEIAVDAPPPPKEASADKTRLEVHKGEAASSSDKRGLGAEMGAGARAGDEAAAGWATWDVSRWALGDPSRPLRPLELGRGHPSDAGAHRKALEGATSPAGGPQPWAPLCQRKASYVPSNQSLVQTVVTGPEDPKLIPLPSGIGAGIAFSSFPPHDGPHACHDPPSMLFGGNKAKFQMFFASPKIFGESSSATALLLAKASGVRADSGRAAGETHATSRADALAASVSASHPSALGYHFECQNQYLPQKNWIGFNHAGVLHMVTSVMPHTVQAVREDGKCLIDSYVTDGYEPLRRLAEGVDVRGSASAIPWRNGTAYLALFHTKNSAGRYTTMAYTFAAEQPFAVTAVSRPIPLAAGSSAFASSLSVPPGGDKVVIGYGAADAEARALVVSTAYLESLFDWSGGCAPSEHTPAPAGAYPATHTQEGSAAGDERGHVMLPAPASAAAVVDPGRTARAYQYAGLVFFLAVCGSAVSLAVGLAVEAQTWWRMASQDAYLK
jgi:hypothetical protein